MGFFFLSKDRHIIELSFAPWHSGTKVEQSAPRLADSLCPLHHANLQSVSVLSAKLTLHFPLGLVAFVIFSSPIKVRRTWNDEETFLNNENFNQSAGFAPTACLCIEPSNLFSVKIAAHLKLG